MRRIFLVFATLGLIIISLSTVSFAADQYAYRAGQTYMKTAANNHTECEAQCRGDAACRGWNFIRPNPRSRSGICEFNARQVAPMSSPISISGEINTRIDQVMSRAVPIAAGNTVRVGTPIMAKPVPKIVPRTVPRITSRPTPVRVAAKPPTNQITRVTQPIPSETIIRAPIPAGFRPIEEVNLQPFTGPIQPRSMTMEQIYREQAQAAQLNAAQNRIARQAQNRAVMTPRPPQQFVPTMKQTPRAPRAPSIQMPPIIPTAIPNQQSLYGSLYDDLTQNMTPVPRPQTAPDQVNNPDAPLATSRAIPVVPVQTVPLGYSEMPKQTLSGLAGGH